MISVYKWAFSDLAGVEHDIEVGDDDDGICFQAVESPKNKKCTCTGLKCRFLTLFTVTSAPLSQNRRLACNIQAFWEQSAGWGRGGNISEFNESTFCKFWSSFTTRGRAQIKVNEMHFMKTIIGLSPIFHKYNVKILEWLWRRQPGKHRVSSCSCEPYCVCFN